MKKYTVELTEEEIEFLKICITNYTIIMSYTTQERLDFANKLWIKLYETMH